MSDKKGNLIVKIILIILICAVDLLWSAHFIYDWKQAGTVISVRNASQDIPGIVLQNMIVAAIPIVLLIIFAVILKGRFADEMYMRLSRNGKVRIVQIRIIILLTVVLAGIAVYAFATKSDKITVLYCMLYYVVFIAFTEEFVVRDVCTYLLKNENGYVRYIVPNVVFAVMHIFAYAGWNDITVNYVISFVTSQMIGLVLVGCFFQFLKEKSQIIWIPVLVHGIMDYLVVLSY